MKHPAAVMVFGFIASDGKKMPTADAYLDVLKKNILRH